MAAPTGQQTFTYSFLDVQATLTGPSGSVSLGSGAGVAEEGITLEFTEEDVSMHIGADGGVAMSLHASKAGRCTVRLLKTSPTNQVLAQMRNAQKQSSLLAGQNTMEVRNMITGDVYTLEQVAFARMPHNAYAKEAGLLDWEFLAGKITPVLGGAGLLLT